MFLKNHYTAAHGPVQERVFILLRLRGLYFICTDRIIFNKSFVISLRLAYIKTIIMEKTKKKKTVFPAVCVERRTHVSHRYLCVCRRARVRESTTTPPRIMTTTIESAIFSHSRAVAANAVSAV